jgi:hypothetical protein
MRALRIACCAAFAAVALTVFGTSAAQAQSGSAPRTYMMEDSYRTTCLTGFTTVPVSLIVTFDCLWGPPHLMVTISRPLGGWDLVQIKGADGHCLTATFLRNYPPVDNGSWNSRSVEWADCVPFAAGAAVPNSAQERQLWSYSYYGLDMNGNVSLQFRSNANPSWCLGSVPLNSGNETKAVSVTRLLVCKPAGSTSSYFQQWRVWDVASGGFVSSFP